jgi:release factor glutamine methyltransferase
MPMTDDAAAPTWGAQLAWGVAQVQASDSATPKLDASVVLAHVLGVPRAALLGFPEREMASTLAAHYAALIARRVTGEPVAYLTGHKEFMGLDLLVDARVLVPRPETELVVEAALAALTARLGELPEDNEDVPESAAPVPDLLAADVGTGSGAIAIALAALEPRLGRIFASDCSPDALDVARHNGDRHSVNDRISWLTGDLLAPVPVPVDLIVANLPYVSTAPGAAQPNVVAHEPHLALFSGADGLDHIRRLIAQAPAKLRPHGSILLEFGFDQGAAVRDLLAAAFPTAQIAIGQDYAGWDRFAVATLP